MFTDVVLVHCKHVSAMLDQLLGPFRLARRPTQSLNDEVVAADLVQHHHVKWRGGGPLLVVAADMKAAGVGAAMEQLMERAGVAVPRHHHVHVGCEELLERAVGKPVGM